MTQASGIAAKAPLAGRSSEPRRIAAPGLSAVPTLLLLSLVAFLAFDPVRSNRHLSWTFAGVSAVLAAWQALLWYLARRAERTLTAEFTPVRSHYVQACVQAAIIAYWAWYAPRVVTALPLILAQLMFLYILEALLTWSRGRTWRIGFGPMPIVLSTNLLLWFKPDWFVFQFLMLTIGALAKQFVTWERDGKRTHIFNPSAFGQFLIALVLIGTGTTNDLTFGREIATSFEAPHILWVIFFGGLLVQYLFHVTLMTVAAVAAICAVNLLHTGVFGTYLFVNINVAAPIFLGVHLLLTDPATSPRTNLGRVIFGVLYGLAYAVLFRVLDLLEVPLFWDKLLPVPILNLCVPLIDRLCRSGLPGWINRAWEGALAPRKLNLVHMGLWVALFATMVLTGFVESPHPGNSIQFWKKAVADGKPHAGHSLVMAVGAHAQGAGSPAALNELGLICIEGKIKAVKVNPGKAFHYFSQACDGGSPSGCANVAIQYLFRREHGSEQAVARAFDMLERLCNARDRQACYLLGVAHEKGEGRPPDLALAADYFRRSGNNLYACKGIARVALRAGGPPIDATTAAAVLVKAAAAGDAESAWYLAYLFARGAGGVPVNAEASRSYMQRAATLGLAPAKAALALPDFPEYKNPVQLVPSFVSDYPAP